MTRLALVSCLLGLVAAGLPAAGAGTPAGAAPPKEGKRYALVIGNSDYPGPQIPGRADAEEMADALDRLGFTVVGGQAPQKALLDADFPLMTGGLQALAKAIKDSGEAPGVVLFYYSGHGFQVDGANYLLPAGTSDITDLKRQAISLEDVVNSYLVIGDVYPNFASKIVIVDACRDNETLQVGGKAPDQGLAQRQFHLPTQAMVFYAADYGAVADGTAIAGHSPFTNAILLNIRSAGAELRDFMASVVEDTRAHTRPRQTPRDDSSSSIPKPFFFKPAVEVGVAITEADDGVFVLSGSNEAARWIDEPPVPHTFFLHGGKNPLAIHVFNQKTYRSSQSWNQPEGWKYTVVLTLPGNKTYTFTSPGESVVAKNGPRFGKLFWVASATLTVNPTTFEVTVDDETKLEVAPEQREDAVLYQLPLLDKTLVIGGRESLRDGVGRCVGQLTGSGRIFDLVAQVGDALLHGRSADDAIQRFNNDFTACVGGIDVWMDLQ
jgi:hypothetical protein